MAHPLSQSPAVEKLQRTSERDLASLACRAAIEFDNFILRRSQKLEAATRLFDAIAQRVTNVAEPQAPLSLLDPATAVALKKAVDDSMSIQVPGQFAELRQHVQGLRTQLDLLSNAEDPDAQKVPATALRAFCLAFSRHVSISVPPRFETTSHPYRR